MNAQKMHRVLVSNGFAVAEQAQRAFRAANTPEDAIQRYGLDAVAGAHYVRVHEEFARELTEDMTAQATLAYLERWMGVLTERLAGDRYARRDLVTRAHRKAVSLVRSDLRLLHATISSMSGPESQVWAAAARIQIENALQARMREDAPPHDAHIEEIAAAVRDQVDFLRSSGLDLRPGAPREQAAEHAYGVSVELWSWNDTPATRSVYVAAMLRELESKES